MWLAATMDGLSVVPISQVIEVAETRAGLPARGARWAGAAAGRDPGRVAGDQPQPAAPHAPSRGGRGPGADMTRRWVLACVLAETFGMAISAGAARGGRPVGAVAGLLLVLAGGLAEGTALGLLQAPRSAPLGHGAWLGCLSRSWSPASGGRPASAPAALSGDDSGGAPPLGLVLLGAAGPRPGHGRPARCRAGHRPAPPRPASLALVHRQRVRVGRRDAGRLPRRHDRRSRLGMAGAGRATAPSPVPSPARRSARDRCVAALARRAPGPTPGRPRAT